MDTYPVGVEPAVLAFLAYDSIAEPRTLGERVRACRRQRGLTQREFAKRLPVAPESI